MRKVTMQDIANALGISRVTVWKVFNDQPGVSDSLRDAVYSKANELGYNKGIVEPVSHRESRNISIVVARPESSTFWTSIIHSMAEEFSQANINLIYTSVDPIYTDSFQLPKTLMNGSFNAAVIMNIYDAEITKRLNQIPLPKVFLDSVPDVTFGDLDGDLILIEGYHTIYKITESVINKGIKNIGFIGDIEYAQTNRDRFTGFKKCMEDHKLPVNKKYCKTDKIDIYSYKQELFDYLDGLETLPDAFICASDYIAHFVQFYLAEHPSSIPKGIVLTGFDANEEYANVDGQITTADVHIEQLGKRLAQQCIYRMNYSDAPYELTYLSPKIIYRDSVINFS